MVPNLRHGAIMRAPRDRLSIHLPPAVAAVARGIAAERDISINDVVRMALGVLQVAEQARRDGHYVGVSQYRDRLDTVMVSPF